VPDMAVLWHLQCRCILFPTEKIKVICVPAIASSTKRHRSKITVLGQNKCFCDAWSAITVPVKGYIPCASYKAKSSLLIVTMG